MDYESKDKQYILNKPIDVEIERIRLDGTHSYISIKNIKECLIRENIIKSYHLVVDHKPDTELESANAFAMKFGYNLYENDNIDFLKIVRGVRGVRVDYDKLIYVDHKEKLWITKDNLTSKIMQIIMNMYDDVNPYLHDAEEAFYIRAGKIFLVKPENLRNNPYFQYGLCFSGELHNTFIPFKQLTLEEEKFVRNYYFNMVNDMEVRISYAYLNTTEKT